MRDMISRFAPAPTGFLHLGHVDHHHCVVRSHRAAGLGEDVWRIHAFGGHRLGQRLHDGRGVLLERDVPIAIGGKRVGQVLDVEQRE